MTEETQNSIIPQIAEKSQIKRAEGGKFMKGNVPKSPGRPKKTEEQRIIEKTVKQYLKEYERVLAEALPEISPALIGMAKRGNVQAITEIHKVIGAHKRTDRDTIVPIQINFGEDRKKYGRF